MPLQLRFGTSRRRITGRGCDRRTTTKCLPCGHCHKHAECPGTVLEPRASGTATSRPPRGHLVAQGRAPAGATDGKPLQATPPRRLSFAQNNLNWESLLRSVCAVFCHGPPPLSLHLPWEGAHCLSPTPCGRGRRRRATCRLGAAPAAPPAALQNVQLHEIRAFLTKSEEGVSGAQTTRHQLGGTAVRLSALPPKDSEDARHAAQESGRRTLRRIRGSSVPPPATGCHRLPPPATGLR